MSSITFSGLGSGMDYASWVDALVEAKKATTITPLETKLESLNNSQKALGIVEQYFQEFLPFGGYSGCTAVFHH